MFRLRRIGIDTQSEHVVFIDERTVREGALGFEPLDRVRVVGEAGGADRESTSAASGTTAGVGGTARIGVGGAPPGWRQGATLRAEARARGSR